MIPTQEELAAIRVRYTEKFPQGYQYSQARVDVLTLLDALDGAESSIALLKELLNDTEKRLYDRGLCATIAEADRDHWKLLAEQNLKTSELVLARAEALERAIHDYQPCWACKLDNTCEYNNSNGCTVCDFQYDYERFAAKEGDGQE